MSIWTLICLPPKKWRTVMSITKPTDVLLSLESPHWDWIYRVGTLLLYPQSGRSRSRQPFSLGAPLLSLDKKELKYQVELAMQIDFYGKWRTMIEKKQRKHHLSEGDEVMGQLLWLCRDSSWGQQDQGGLWSWEMLDIHVRIIITKKL